MPLTSPVRVDGYTKRLEATDGQSHLYPMTGKTDEFRKKCAGDEISFGHQSADPG